MALDIKVDKKKNFVYTVRLTGSIDGETYQELDDTLKELMDEKTKAVMLDMGGVNYVSSIGIRVIVSVQKALKEKSATFAMINLQPQIKKVFDVLKILPMFDIFDDMPEADKYIDQIIKEEIEKQNA
ncbi:MAG: STAS domain-containing protein [Candidatus Omnitrophota bacterium]